jgi:hypothetical protein
VSALYTSLSKTLQSSLPAVATIGRLSPQAFNSSNALLPALLVSTNKSARQALLSLLSAFQVVFSKPSVATTNTAEHDKGTAFHQKASGKTIQQNNPALNFRARFAELAQPSHTVLDELHTHCSHTPV